MRSAHRLAPLAVLVSAAFVAAPRVAQAQQVTTPVIATAPIADERPRFEILAVGDSTFTFAVGSRHWVSAHARGDAVDPKRRNALVARFEVMSVSAGVATALITGETTRLNTSHVALLDAPREAFYRSARFWGGVVAGAVAGGAITAALK